MEFPVCTAEANCSSGPCFTADSSLAFYSSKKFSVAMPEGGLVDRSKGKAVMVRTIRRRVLSARWVRLGGHTVRLAAAGIAATFP
ncbi:hypothetical protein T02_3036 [Trichinella nativa]|uniref:Uncharacterized protein n=1 Tax=Trichinella nativa TaxID=6335 RepID=A0A0V1L503_9BILA|nr:hypothetical protein T02_3036 [Trichinella nativa]